MREKKKTVWEEEEEEEEEEERDSIKILRGTADSLSRGNSTGLQSPGGVHAGFG